MLNTQSIPLLLVLAPLWQPAHKPSPAVALSPGAAFSNGSGPLAVATFVHYVYHLKSSGVVMNSVSTSSEADELLQDMSTIRPMENNNW